jgi:hypothetical protein
VDSILKVVPHGENIAGNVIQTKQVVRMLERLEDRLVGEGMKWQEVSLLVLFDSKAAPSDKDQHDSNESIKAGIEQFCGGRDWHPPLIGSSVYSSFFRHGEDSDPEIGDGLLFVACASAVLPKIPVAYEITEHDADRRYAGKRALEQGVQLVRQQMHDVLSVDVPAMTVTKSSIGLIFTTGSGHIEAQEEIDFKDCYAVGQELLKAAGEHDAELYGGCATNRTQGQVQCLYYSEEIGGRTHYRCTYRHGAVLAFLPYTLARPHLMHPYRRVEKIGRLDIEFHERDQYADGRYFYVRRINGRAPIEFLADYWKYTEDDLIRMTDEKTSIPSEPDAHYVTIASSLNRFDNNAWPNVPIWLDREGDEILLRLVRAEADDGNYYLMEMKPEYLHRNAEDLITELRTSVSNEASLISFLCESRKYVLNKNNSNADAETMLAGAPEGGALVGVYINGEYSTGATTSIGYHNYSQISAIIPRRPIRSLPDDVNRARASSSLRIFMCHASRDKSTVREIAEILEEQLPGATRWIDEKALGAGDHLSSGIRSAIGEIDQFFVAFISDRSVSSDWVKRELAWAFEEEDRQNRVVVLPVVLDDTGGSVLEELRESWTPDLVRLLDEKVRLTIHDFTDTEISAKARLLADQIKALLVKREEEDGGPAFPSHPAR